MKNKKRILALALIVVLALNACGKKDNNNQAQQSPTTTVAPTETPTEIPTETPSETPNQGEANNGEEQMAQIPSNADLDAFHTRVLEIVGENYIPSAPYDATSLEELFGVKPDWYDAAIAEGPMMSVHVDKLLAIHATEGNLENVQNALKAYRESIVADTMNYPMNLNRIQASIVDTVGDYVLFIMVGNIDEMKYETEDEMIAAYAEQNQLVVDAAKETLAK